MKFLTFGNNKKDESFLLNENNYREMNYLFDVKGKK